jgi:exosortase
VTRRERLAWIGLLICAVAAYGPVLAKLATDWWNVSDASHGLICAPLAVAIGFARRRELAETPRAPRDAGLIGVVLGLVLLALGRLGVELFLTRASLILFTASSIVFLFGWRSLRVLAFPFALFALSIPIPSIVMTRVTLPLQFLASATAETALSAFHIPVLREGNVLVLTNATLQVAEACSGVRSMMSLVVIGVIVARYLEHRAAARVAIVLAAVPVTVAINAFRVSATAVATQYYGISAAVGLPHEAMGLVLFAVSALALTGCARAVAAVHLRRSSGALS